MLLQWAAIWLGSKRGVSWQKALKIQALPGWWEGSGLTPAWFFLGGFVHMHWGPSNVIYALLNRPRCLDWPDSFACYWQQSTLPIIIRAQPLAHWQCQFGSHLTKTGVRHLLFYEASHPGPALQFTHNSIPVFWFPVIFHFHIFLLQNWLQQIFVLLPPFCSNCKFNRSEIWEFGFIHLVLNMSATLTTF